LAKAPNDTREVAKGKRVRDITYIGKPKRKWKPDGMKWDWQQKRYVEKEN
jgi:hypothetical protein